MGFIEEIKVKHEKFKEGRSLREAAKARKLMVKRIEAEGRAKRIDAIQREKEKIRIADERIHPLRTRAKKRIASFAKKKFKEAMRQEPIRKRRAQPRKRRAQPRKRRAQPRKRRAQPRRSASASDFFGGGLF